MAYLRKQTQGEIHSVHRPFPNTCQETNGVSLKYRELKSISSVRAKTIYEDKIRTVNSPNTVLDTLQRRPPLYRTGKAVHIVAFK